MYQKKFLHKLMCLSLIVSFLLPINYVNAAEESQLKDQLVTDLVAAGVSIGAALSGNVALALTSGILTKYISTYGVQGVKKLINYFKGATPRDLGEINLYYTYLINIKRNLYFTMLNIRKSVKNDEKRIQFEEKLKQLTDDLLKDINSDETFSIEDDSLVNISFVELAMDQNQSLDISKLLQDYEIKATYKYLMLLYIDIVLVEQKLIEAQYDVMANQVSRAIKHLDESKYSSQDEKEFLYQNILNIALRWTYLRDNRRVMLTTLYDKSIQSLQGQNDDLDDLLGNYKKLNKNENTDEEHELLAWEEE